MFCTKCGSEIADGSKFCPKCGASMAGAEKPGAGAPVTGASSAGRQGQSPCPTEGSPSASFDSGAAAPSKRKPSGKVIAGAAAAVAVVAVVAGVAIANPFAAPEPAPEPEPAPVAAPEPAAEPEPAPAPVPEPEPEPEPVTVPATSFSKRLSTEGAFELYDMQGEKVEPSIKDAEFAGPFSGGFIVGTWWTEEYDKEFDTVYDRRMHVGVFDGTGKLAFELTDTLVSLGVDPSFTLNRSEALCYSDERLVVPIYYSVERTEPREDGKMYDEFHRTFVFDTAGKLVFEFEYATETVHYAGDSGTLVYRDGVLLAHKAGAFGEVLYDVDGKVLVDCDGSQFDSLTPYGYGYYSYGSGRGSDPVLAYGGTVALDPATLDADGIVNASLFGSQPLTGGVVAVQAEKENPHEGGRNLAVAGIYSLADGRWVFPLEKEFESGAGYGGVFPVLQTSEAPTAEGAGADSAADGEADEAPQAKLANGKGETVFDASMLDGGPTFKFIDGYEHLHDGYWKIDGFTYDTNNTVIVYIKDGTYQGYQVLDFLLS